MGPEDRGYWARRLPSRVGRRSFLAALGTSLASASLAACGIFDDEEGGGAPEDKSGLLSKPEDTTSKAVRGGILPSFVVADTLSFDGLTSLPVSGSFWNDWSYARLVDFHIANVVAGEKRGNSVDPYGAESWEVTPDRLQYTFRLQPEGKLDPRPPTNGRLLDADDVVFSWNRFRSGHRSRTTLVHELNPLAPIESITAMDSRTVVMKLAFPTVSILQTLAHWMVSPALMPREADGGFDPRQSMRGSGPWMLTEYQPGIGYKLRRNPNFFHKDRPLVDGIDLPIINEYAQGVAQLKAGNIYFYFLNSEDVLQTKADVPALKMYAHGGYPANVGVTAVFDFRAGSVFRDERVRQAMSMLIDRDRFIDVRHNVTAFANAGLPVSKRWTTLLSSGEEDFWLDPQSSEFGENARYFRHDVSEARKLLQAAGTGVIDQPLALVAGQELGPAHKDEVEVLRGMWESTGDIRLRANPVDFSTVFQPRYIVNSPRRDFEGKGGMVMANLPDQAEVDSMLAQYYSRGGGSYRFEPDFPNDARWDSLVQAQSGEFDETKRKALLHDLQRHAAAKAYTIHRPGWALGFSLVQPWIMNHGAFYYRLNFTGTGPVLRYWLDEPRRSKQ